MNITIDMQAVPNNILRCLYRGPTQELGNQETLYSQSL
jgi:hypothetical protein